MLCSWRVKADPVILMFMAKRPQNAFLRSSVKLRYQDHDDALDFGTLFTDIDDQFFHKIINNRLHILQQFIPDRTSVNYNLCLLYTSDAADE